MDPEGISEKEKVQKIIDELFPIIRGILTEDDAVSLCQYIADAESMEAPENFYGDATGDNSEDNATGAEPKSAATNE